MFEIRKTKIDGFTELQPDVRRDERGSFVKTFHRKFFADNGLPAGFAELYYSASMRRVLRGFHFQLPPHDHAKLVCCIFGEVMDVALDLRTDSLSFGQCATVTLSADRANQVVLASGLAHAFYVLSEMAVVAYSVTTMYAPEHDTGIRWDSVPAQWPDSNPLLSPRDAALPSLSEFQSPFRMRRAK